MVCKACGHCWGSLLPPARCLRNAERPYRPAKVVRVHREVGDGIVYLPVLEKQAVLRTLRPLRLRSVPWWRSTNAVFSAVLTGEAASAALTASSSPNTMRGSTWTTRPLYRVLCTVA